MDDGESEMNAARGIKMKMKIKIKIKKHLVATGPLFSGLNLNRNRDLNPGRFPLS